MMLSASSVLAGQKPKDVNCTHLVLGGAKSKTTAVARSLCHALQAQGATSCIHEPLRMQHEEADWYPYQWRSTKFKAADTTLCKDMLYQAVKPALYKDKLSDAIKKTQNPIVFMKGNPVGSFLSLVGLQLKNLNEHFNFKLKERLATKEQIDRFATQVLKPVAQEVLGTAKSYLDMTDLAQKEGKTVVELQDADLQLRPKEELNKVLASWGRSEIPIDKKMTMSEVVNVGDRPPISNQTLSSSYQIGVRDPWDTVTGTEFSPAEVSKSRQEQIESLVTRYVPEPMHAHFANVLNKYAAAIETKIEGFEAKYASEPNPGPKDEL